MSNQLKYIILGLLTVLVALCSLLLGAVSIPVREVFSILCGQDGVPAHWQYIVWQIRVPAMLTAALTGASLGVAGLLLQSYFRNPLAGPSILGITNGANLGVALVIVGTGTSAAFNTIGAALAGAMLTLLLLLGIGRLVRQSVTLLIVGILLSYLTSAILTLIHYNASADGVQALLLWGMGSFHQVGLTNLPLFAASTLLPLVAALWLIRPLNGWMLGELYARNLGISTTQVRWLVLIVTGVICAITTSWCGPIAFIGLSIPHVARMVFHTDNHRTLLPATMLLGALCALLCLCLCVAPSDGQILPVNAVTPLFGIPVILWVILGKRK
ncbi:MAG: iron ABC transporter permease [Bacteroidales bacterium]|nr:iron ABC transporter permease [Bacteroidales bacterium]